MTNLILYFLIADLVVCVWIL